MVESMATHPGWFLDLRVFLRVLGVGVVLVLLFQAAIAVVLLHDASNMPGPMGLIPPLACSACDGSTTAHTHGPSL